LRTIIFKKRKNNGMKNFDMILIITACTSAILIAALKTKWIFKQPRGSEKLQSISAHVAEGAMVFLKREYKVLLPFVLLVASFLALANQGYLRFQAISFLLGASCSALAGYIGMKVATAANSRTTEAAQQGINPALKIAFSGGSVMGMTVAGLSLGGVMIVLSFAIGLIGYSVENMRTLILPIVSGFSLGASSIALFARVGGGIFTKAADVGADLVGKIEAGIPEDDPRNPAVIADNVGDNVGDVAGMGADLFESFAGSLIGCMILGLSINGTDEMRLKLVQLPLILASTGILSSILCMLLVRVKKGKSPQKALNTGTFTAAILTAALSYPICSYILQGITFNNGAGALHLFFSTVIGLLSGTLIGLLTEYFTGTGTRPVLSIVRSCETGSATTIITGMGVGMFSTFPPVIIICGAIWGSYTLAGLYGVSIAALGMLLTIGIQLAVDAYGPIADNAGGLAVMTGYPSKVRRITDQLDAVGNTTAAIGKGFAIGSAALTALILLNSFKTLTGYEKIDLTSPPVLIGLISGSMIPYLFSSLAMTAVGRAAFQMIEEVRRQFTENKGILNGTETPDYVRCIDISTSAALKEMILPGLIAILTPILVGFLGGIPMLIGLLTGVTASGVVLALFMSNAGGAWDNAKKMVESDSSRGKGTDIYRAAVVGDTVGDPFKDTAGPALNILIKLMAIVSLVIAPLLMEYWR
jgi:K(+)-stimulated pyrophosphate-energized sodium pump